MSLTPNVPQLISPMHVCWYRPSHKANCHHNTKALEQISSVTVKARVKTFTASWRAVARHALLVLARAVLPRRKLGQPPACICSVAVKYLGDQDGKATKRFKVKVPVDISDDNLQTVFCTPLKSLESEAVSMILTKWKQFQTQERDLDFVVVSTDLGDGGSCMATIPFLYRDSVSHISVVKAICHINQLSKHN